MADTRIPQRDVRGLSDDALFEKLLGVAYEHQDSLTPGQALIARLVSFIRDVDNGGITQALWNRDLDETEQVIGDFEVIGAAEHADAVRQAVRTLAGGRWPASDADMESRLERISIDWIEANMTRYDEMLYFENRLWPHFNLYLVAHPNDFFLPE
jgi:uncharacterized protein DUF4375